MATLVTDPRLEERLLEQRRAWGADKFDEVWEGVYLMAPLPNNEHQSIAFHLGCLLDEALGESQEIQVLVGVNLAGPSEDWEQDFRCPDVAVFLKDTQAENFETHWRGAADFLVEITSPGDRTYEKVPFYDRIGVHELLIVNREQWILELYQRRAGRLSKTAQSQLPESGVLAAGKVPLTFRLIPGKKRPAIEVARPGGGRTWMI
jgi:Uma2 family endonuclease